eukprot:533113_1
MSYSHTSTFTSKISWTNITAHKCEYMKTVFGAIWLATISITVILLLIVWNTQWNNNFANINHISNQDIYYIILTIFLWTILFICILFICQYFILPATLPTIYSYKLKEHIPGIKHKRNANINSMNEKLLIATPKDDIKYEEIKEEPNVKQSLLQKRDTTIARTDQFLISKCERCFKYAFTSKWTIYNWLSIPVILFHLFHTVIIINSFWCNDITISSIIQIIYHISRSFSDILPGICLIMFWKAKQIYNPVESFVKKFEKRILSKELNANNKNKNGSLTTTEINANRFKYANNTKTLA